MRTSPTGVSSTSGVSPISPRRFGATALRKVGHFVIGGDAERCESVAEAGRAARLERSLGVHAERGLLATQELVKVLDCRHSLPPAIAGSRITVESGRT